MRDLFFMVFHHQLKFQNFLVFCVSVIVASSSEIVYIHWFLYVTL